MAAIGTRAEIVAHPDYYFLPLSAKPMPDAELTRTRPVFREVLAPSAIRLPNADGVLDETDNPVAMGLVYTVALTALDQSGQSRTRQGAVWSTLAGLCHGPGEAPATTRPRAVTEINALDARKQGKQRVPDEATAS